MAPTREPAVTAGPPDGPLHRALRAERAAGRTARRELRQARRALHRVEAAIAHGLPLAYAHRLQGDTREALNADATVLLAELALPARPAPAREIDALARLAIPTTTTA